MAAASNGSYGLDSCLEVLVYIFIFVVVSNATPCSLCHQVMGRNYHCGDLEEGEVASAVTKEGLGGCEGLIQ